MRARGMKCGRDSNLDHHHGPPSVRPAGVPMIEAESFAAGYGRAGPQSSSPAASTQTLVRVLTSDSSAARTDPTFGPQPVFASRGRAGRFC